MKTSFKQLLSLLKLKLGEAIDEDKFSQKKLLVEKNIGDFFRYFSP